MNNDKWYCAWAGEPPNEPCGRDHSIRRVKDRKAMHYDTRFAAENAAWNAFIIRQRHVSVYRAGDIDPVSSTAEWAIVDNMVLIKSKGMTQYEEV